MGNRIDELQGQIKQGVGTLMGNEELEREGATQSERARLQREADGWLAVTSQGGIPARNVCLALGL